MNIIKTRKSYITVESSLKEQYPCRMQLYNDPPMVQISLQEFELYAIERLKVLRVLEMISLKGAAKNSNEYKSEAEKEIRKTSLRFYHLIFTSKYTKEEDEIKDYEARKIDHISHYILRFAYCHSEEHRRWFIAREYELFKLRWSHLLSDETNKFIAVNHLNYQILDEITCKQKSVNSGGLIKPENTYYCVKWTNVLDLVRGRRVYLERGIAYVTSTDLISVLGSVFRSNLSHHLAIMSHKVSAIQSDERFKRLKNLHNTYTGKTYVRNDNDRQVSLENLDSLSKTSFPLCMKQLHAALKTHHHLRHFGRQQFSLFLKGVGLSLEDALIFWRSEFTKKMDSDQFDKKYAYNFRHNYGKEGKRANYTPYSCGKIIASSAGPGEYHGCPFKHNDVASLKQTFASLHIGTAGSEEVLQYVNMGQYQLACAKFFEVTHNAPILTGVNHPNQYFEESQKLLASGIPNTPGPAPKRKSTQPTPTTAKKSMEDCLDDSAFDKINLDQLDGITV
ncbi:DNA primase large subunit-like [Planococcus citri]|uniref:DNA primase large subunit-like n=1 Tax=Planococcus citri TaxID=170843 RepID=UPI0031F72C39